MKRKRNSICKCGCGELCTKVYKQGHYARICPPGKALLGKDPWNKNKILGKNPIHSERMKKWHKEGIFKNAYFGANGKKPPSPKGRKAWNKGLTKETSDAVKRLSENPIRKEKIGRTIKRQYDLGRKAPMLGRKNIHGSRKMKENWKNPEYIAKMNESWCNKPTKPELEMKRFLELNFGDEWKYSGDGSFWITAKSGKRMNPDFICVSKKLVIEVCGEYWHTEKDVSERTKNLQEVGWKCLIIWCKELENKETMLSKIRSFIMDAVCIALFGIIE